MEVFEGGKKKKKKVQEIVPERNTRDMNLKEDKQAVLVCDESPMGAAQWHQ